MHAIYVSHMGSDNTVCDAARVSMNKRADQYTDEQNHKLIKYLASHNHFTPFCHPQITLNMQAPVPIRTQCFKSKIGFVENECFDDQTEVLTNSGWKLWSEVTDKDLLATPAKDFSSYSFLKPKRLIKQEYQGPMLHCTSRDLDMMCTPNHEQPISYFNQQGGKYWTSFTKVFTHQISSLKFAKLPAVPSLYMEQGSDYWLGVFQGMFLGDGMVSKDARRIYFHVKKERKKKYLRELAKHTPELTWKESPQKDGYSYFRCYNLYDFSGSSLTKSIEWLSDTAQYTRGLFDGLIASDGHISSKNNTTFSTISLALYEGMQVLCTKLGRDITTHIKEARGNWNRVYKLTIKVSRPKLIRHIRQIPYSGYIYCAETETGYLIVRRNGKSNVSGNSSRRYISDTPTIYIPEFRTKPEGSIKQGSGGIHPYAEQWAIQYSYHCKDAVRLYEKMIADGVAPEQARFILPQGAEVNWIWTGSLYAYARFFNLRSDSHAQSEIQTLANEVASIIQPLFPVSWEALTHVRA